jgi:hypothetical protein
MKRIIGELWQRSSEWLDRNLQEQCAALHAHSRPVRRMHSLRANDMRSRALLFEALILRQTAKRED